ncbi:DNA alkylation repair protein [Ornithobacterium rhinotracheale]|uniref:DNA alkylation repair protein n=1 Tax=Ornithobacterium rhinotracheale TaxID=28251 RepID=UPI003FA40BF3
MEVQKTYIQKRLFLLQDKSYKDFQERLIPTVEPDRIIGIRTPRLRKFAKDFFKEKPERLNEFLADLPHTYYEENNLHLFLVSEFKDLAHAISETERILPYIDNWATCDITRPKVFEENPELIYAKIKEWITSEHEFTIRYAIGILLELYLDENFSTEHLDLVASVTDERYYVQMMMAWYFSYALIKQYEHAIPYLEQHKLPPFVHTKTIQKAIESRRVSDKKKSYLKTLRQKS